MANNESSNSCCKIETGALIFGIINIVLTGIASLMFVGLTIYVGIQLGDLCRSRPLLSRRYGEEQLTFQLLMVVIAMPIALVSLVFAVLLVVGVAKKKPTLVLTYFIFGIIATVSSIAGVSVFYHDTRERAFLMPMIIIIVAVLLLYTLPLSVVFLTFRKFRANAMYAPNYDPVQT